MPEICERPHIISRESRNATAGTSPRFPSQATCCAAGCDQVIPKAATPFKRTEPIRRVYPRAGRLSPSPQAQSITGHLITESESWHRIHRTARVRPLEILISNSVARTEIIRGLADSLSYTAILCHFLGPRRPPMARRIRIPGTTVPLIGVNPVSRPPKSRDTRKSLR